MITSAFSCRVCLLKCKDSNPLSEICLSKHCITFLDAFNSCTQLGAQSEDGYPQFLCTTCSQELQLCYIFLQKAKETDSKLRKTSFSAEQKQHSSLFLEELNPESNVDENNDNNLDGNLCTKDPLEETEDEKEFDTDAVSDKDYGVHWAGNLEGASETDEEDNKPLKDLLKEVNETQITMRNDWNISNQMTDRIKHNTNMPGDITEKAKHEFDSDVTTNSTKNVADISLSAETQIFPQGRFKCEACGKLYFTKIGLKAHLEVHFPKSAAAKKKRTRNPKKKKTKTEPTEDYDVESDINKVQNTSYTEEKPVLHHTQLETTNVALEKSQRRIRKQKLPKPKKMFPCQICNKHMISASKLRYHMVMHTGEKDFLCTMCPKAYSTIYALKHHLRTHTGERPYECKFCGDKFTRPTTLKSHMRRHTGERPYGCDICGKRFIQHSSMTTHMKLNHMAKTIPCPHCDKKYARQTDLNTHLLSHTGDKPFSCQLCPSRFIRQANLNKHMNQHHSARPNDTKSSKTVKRTHTKSLPSDTKQESSEMNIEAVATTQANDYNSVESELYNNDTKFTIKAIVTNNHTLAAEASMLQNTSSLQVQQNLYSTNPTPITNSADIKVAKEMPMEQYVKNSPLDSHTKVDNMQQPLYNDSVRLSRPIEDLNRWNWPNHT